MAAANDPLVTTLLQLLPGDGGSLGNETLRRRLSERLGHEVDDPAYAAARDALVAAGVVEKGRGRGGSLRLAAATRADLQRVADSPAVYRGDASGTLAPAVAARDAGAAPRRGRAARNADDGATVGFEAQLWAAADALRNNMDAAEYKHVVLGLIFLKYISDAFAERHAQLEAERAQGADPEDPDEYRRDAIFWVPPEARWPHLKAQARQPGIGQLVDDAMAGIERDNPALKGVLPKDYARPALDKARLGQLIDLISNIKVGDEASRAKDVLGRVYEYFLSQFAGAEGKKGGEFYTPRCVVKLLVEMIEPWHGRVYDPCCGSSGMFVQSVEFIRAHANGNGNGGKAKADISIYGQESNYTTWRLAQMNLAIRGIDGQIAQGDTFHSDRFPDLKADFILANPPFNISDWGGERLRDDPRWRYGTPPPGNANFGWVQHMVHHLAPAGVAGFVLANGSMSSNQSGEGEIRKALVEADLVDCMIALPGQLFYSTQIPACLWFLRRDRSGRHSREGGNPAQTPDRRGQVLFIDARKLGRMVDRTHRELTDADIARIAGTYHAWRGEPLESRHSRAGGNPVSYADIPGYCKSAALEDIRKHGHVLTPGRYVGAEAVEDDGEPFADKMQRLAAQLREQQAEAARLDAAIAANLAALGFTAD
ncbi:type I restriction-modification system subunit M [Metallibacterium scheffleri]|uniref:class I SAM-dependent DNA methyltransferase n=1 Tax=Metallibacterium scheffleri TaxID=993689 RepID=UPI0023F52925|nr:class I SAM-dependent DNA methyltransferase [Metallibacterium scheffleri]